MFSFKCKVCDEKDKRIVDLKEQLQIQTNLIRSLVSPQYTHAVTTELNYALDGAGKPQAEISEEQKEKYSAVEQQALSLLTGTYN